jgi:hypothetical protein
VTTDGQVLFWWRLASFTTFWPRTAVAAYHLSATEPAFLPRLGLRISQGELLLRDQGMVHDNVSKQLY